MTPDDTMVVAVTADTSAMDRSLDALGRKASSFGAAMTVALRSAAQGTRSLDDTMRTLALRISTIALDAALRPLGDLAGGMVGRLATGLGNALFGGGGPGARVTPFAKGGVVRAPTFFPNGGSVGLMGEAGAEAILPLRRGPGGELGVAASGGASRSAPSIVFNVTSPDAASFRRSEVQIQAMLARAAARGQRGL